MKINQKQKYVIIGGLLLIVVMVLFPPWYATYYGGGGIIQMPELYTYSFIGKPPPRESRRITFRVDMTRLSLQELAVVALTAVGVLAFSKEIEPDS